MKDRGFRIVSSEVARLQLLRQKVKRAEKTDVLTVLRVFELYVGSKLLDVMPLKFLFEFCRRVVLCVVGHRIRTGRSPTGASYRRGSITATDAAQIAPSEVNYLCQVHCLKRL